jgi:hypothetical protein
MRRGLAVDHVVVGVERDVGRREMRERSSTFGEQPAVFSFR